MAEAVITLLASLVIEKLMKDAMALAQRFFLIKKYCQNLADTVYLLKPAIDMLLKSGVSNSTCTSLRGGAQDPTYSFARKVNTALMNALAAVEEAKGISGKLLARRRVLRLILKATSEIEEVLRYAPAIQMAQTKMEIGQVISINNEMRITLRGINEKVGNVQGQLEELFIGASQRDKKVLDLIRDLSQVLTDGRSGTSDLNSPAVRANSFLDRGASGRFDCGFRCYPRALDDHILGLDFDIHEVSRILVKEKFEKGGPVPHGSPLISTLSVRSQAWLAGNSTGTRSPKEFKTVGLLGMGGIGKTTLAAAVYNLKIVHEHFDRGVFWLTVGRAPDLLALQKELWKRLVKAPCSFNNVGDGLSELKKKMAGARILLVLDDVWRKGHISPLDVVDAKVGSKMLITTRNEDVLNQPGIGAPYRLRYLRHSDAFELFCWHAFDSHNPPVQLYEAAEEVCKECGGLPLAIKVVGATLFGQHTSEGWEVAKRTLADSKSLDGDHAHEVLRCLGYSYDALGDIDNRLQDLFLDFAAFPEDYDIPIDVILDIWAANRAVQTYEEAVCLLGKLVGRSMVMLGDGTCKIHDVMRDMALDLIQGGGERDGNLEEIFTWNRVFFSGHVLGLKDVWRRNTQLRATKMSLHTSSVDELPSDVRMPNLEVLLLCGNPKLVRLPHSTFKSMQQLQVLDLTGCTFLKKLPPVLNTLTRLLVLRLRDCMSLMNLPSGIDAMTRLQVLDLGNCVMLVCLPTAVLALGQLRVLHLGGCKQVRAPLPRSPSFLEYMLKKKRGSTSSSRVGPTVSLIGLIVQELTSLEVLSMRGLNLDACPTIPPGISDLKGLRMLDLASTNIIEVPDEVCSLRNLTMLDLSESSVMQLPLRIGALKKLRKLNLANCKALRQIPRGLGRRGALQKLEVLDLQGCVSLESLPEIEGGAMPQLVQLHLGGALESLPRGLCSPGVLPELQVLIMSNCGISVLPEFSLGALPKLRELRLEQCERLDVLPKSLGWLPSLQHLSCKGCKLLGGVPDAVGSKEGGVFFSDLQHLELSSQSELLRALPAFGRECMPRLTVLEARCGKLRSLPPSISSLEWLCNLDLRACGLLSHLPAEMGYSGSLPQLKELNLTFCRALEELPDIFAGALPRLQALLLDGCKKLRVLPESLVLLSSLKTLSLDRCSRIKTLPPGIINGVENGQLLVVGFDAR